MKLFDFEINHRQVRDVEHEGFFHGAHGISSENGTAEIDALFEQKIHHAKQQSASRKSLLDAKLDRLTALAPSVAQSWQAVRSYLDPEDLRLVLPVIVLLLGCFALATEVILLAPSLDLLDITDPTVQFIAAFGLASLASVLLHLAWETLEDHRASPLTKVIWRVLGGLTAAALVLWGILRGYQVAFAADLNRNQLGRFLAGHPVLASIFYIFITVGAPLAAAIALSHGGRHLRDWRRYHQTRRRAERLAQELAALKKQIDAENDWLRHELGKLSHERREWMHAYLRQYERGQKTGARQSPSWLVHAKAWLAAIVTLVIGLLLFPLSPLSFLLAAAAYLAAFLYFQHHRLHPTPAQFYKLARVTFAEVPTTPLVEERVVRTVPVAQLQEENEILPLPKKKGK